jgi:hypothetical protein
MPRRPPGQLHDKLGREPLPMLSAPPGGGPPTRNEVARRYGAGNHLGRCRIYIHDGHSVTRWKGRT